MFLYCRFAVFYGVLFLGFCFAFSDLSAEEKYKMEPYSVKIEIDGQPKEKLWQQLPYSSSFLSKDKQASEEYQTRFKAFSDKENLYLLIELKGQKLEDIAIDPKTGKEDLTKNHLGLHFAPQAEKDDHYNILLGFNGSYEESFVPAKAGHGFPYSPSVDKKWDSKINYALSEIDDTIYFEIKLPVRSLNLESKVFDHFGLNISRKLTYKEDKQTVSLLYIWNQGALWNTQDYGLAYGALLQSFPDFTEHDLKNIDQMTNGMTALLKSLDIYYKATINYKFLYPEGTEVNGDLSNFDHIPLPQYPVKADGYFRFYHALKYEPYKKMAEAIIDRLYRVYSSTKTADDQHYLVWNNLMSKDGNVYAYGKGDTISMFKPPNVLYDQSKNLFHLKAVVYPDGFGQGFLDLSEIRDSLELETRNKIIEMLSGTLKFLHQDYMLVDELGDSQYKNSYFWRIDAVDTQNPEVFKQDLKPADWPYLGQDIILMILALHNFDEDLAKPYMESLEKFSKFYRNYRLSLNEEGNPHKPRHLLKLDHRLLTVMAYAQEKGLSQFAELGAWLKKELPIVYAHLPKVVYSVNGQTTNSWSTQEMLEIYRLLDMKKEYKEFWKNSFEDALKPIGLSFKHQVLPMNFSSYPLYFDYSYKALQSALLSEKQARTVFKKMFSFYGNPALLRDNLKYSLDLSAEQRTRPRWGNTPYRDYVEGVLPEGIYANGSSQASYGIWENNSKSKYFVNGVEHARYKYTFYYYQYSAPFQYHYDRYSYGKAESYTLLQMPFSEVKEEALAITDGVASFSFLVETPHLKAGFPVFGHLDISDVLFKEFAAKPTDYKLIEVLCDGQAIAFRTYHIFDHGGRVFTGDKAKLVFGFFLKEKAEKPTITLKFKKKEFKQYFGSKSGSKIQHEVKNEN